MTALFGVVGDPIAHSLSPLIHTGWMKTHGLDAKYEAIRIPEGGFAEGLHKLEARGLVGLNVTLPHKTAAAEIATHASEAVARLGVANTLHRKDNVWHADNTDVGGFQDMLTSLLDAPLKDQRVTVLGAGGSARAIVYALSVAGAQITLCNRTLSRAEDLLKDLEIQHGQTLDLETGLSQVGDADLVVNTTSAGHGGTGFDLPDGGGRPLVDISYGPAADKILTPARANGWKTSDGLSMLVHQAARSFEIWFDIAPDTEDALKRCRAALETKP